MVFIYHMKRPLMKKKMKKLYMKPLVMLPIDIFIIGMKCHLNSKKPKI